MDTDTVPDGQHDRPQAILNPTIDDQVFVKVCYSSTPYALDLILHLLPSFNFHYANVVRVKLYIDGTQRATRLIRRSTPDAREVFTVHDDYWQDEPDARMAVFHLTCGTSARLASGDFAPLKDIKGITYLLDFPLTSKKPPIDNVVAGSDASEHIDIAQADSEIWEDAHSFAHSDHAGAVDDFTSTTEEHQKLESAATSILEDNMVRLSQATRGIFLEDAEDNTERATVINLTSLRSNPSVSPSSEADTEPAGPVRASTQYVGPDGPMPNLSTTDEPLFRNGNWTQIAIDGDEFNILGDASELNDGDHPVATFQPDGPDRCPTSGATNADTLFKIDWKRDSKNNSNRLRTLEGKDANLRLRKHAASNDKALRSGGVPTVYRCRKLGTHQEIREANTRLQGITVKQVEYHDALRASKNLSVVAGRELSLQLWKDDAIVEYEKQLDAAISIIKGETPADTTAPSTPAAPVSSHKPHACGLGLRTPSSLAPAQRGSSTDEDSDDSELPDLDSIIKDHLAEKFPAARGRAAIGFAKEYSSAHGGDGTECAKKQPAIRSVEESEERPSKRPRFEAIFPVTADWEML